MTAAMKTENKKIGYLLNRFLIFIFYFLLSRKLSSYGLEGNTDLSGTNPSPLMPSKLFPA